MCLLLVDCFYSECLRLASYLQVTTRSSLCLLCESRTHFPAILSYHIHSRCDVSTWCDVMWCDVMWCDVATYMMRCDAMWCDAMWCDVMWRAMCDVMWCDVNVREVIYLPACRCWLSACLSAVLPYTITPEREQCERSVLLTVLVLVACWVVSACSS